MSLKTAFLNLFKPEAGDKFSITGTEGYNKNMDLIDKAVKKNADGIAQLNSDISFKTYSVDYKGNSGDIRCYSYGRILFLNGYITAKTTADQLALFQIQNCSLVGQTQCIVQVGGMPTLPYCTFGNISTNGTVDAASIKSGEVYRLQAVAILSK